MFNRPPTASVRTAKIDGLIPFIDYLRASARRKERVDASGGEFGEEVLSDSPQALAKGSAPSARRAESSKLVIFFILTYLDCEMISRIYNSICLK